MCSCAHIPHWCRVLLHSWRGLRTVPTCLRTLQLFFYFSPRRPAAVTFSLFPFSLPSYKAYQPPPHLPFVRVEYFSYFACCFFSHAHFPQPVLSFSVGDLCVLLLTTARFFFRTQTSLLHAVIPPAARRLHSKPPHPRRFFSTPHTHSCLSFFLPLLSRAALVFLLVPLLSTSSAVSVLHLCLL